MSASEYEHDDSEDEGILEGFSVIPRSGDWERFRTYARRVKKISFDGNNSMQLSEELMLHVSVANKQPLLPNLNTLVWVSSHPSSLFFSVTLIPPTLRSLQVVISNFTWHATCIAAFLDRIRVSAPALIEFQLFLNWQFAPGLYVDALVELLQSLPNLRIIKLSSMVFTPEVVEALTKLPHIERLEYHPQYRRHRLTHPSLPPPLLRMQPGSFSGLRVLATTLSSIAVFILTTDRRLEYLHSLDIQGISLTDNIKETFQTLSTVFPILAILKLRFCYRNPTIMTMDILRPLFDIPQIKEFYLSNNLPCDISDIEVEEISKKWPLLEVLHLNEGPNAKLSKVSLSALIPLAKNCRGLYRLGLNMNGEVPATESIPSPFTRLETLSVGNSLVTKPAKTATFLSRLCHGPLRILGPTEVLWNSASNFADEDYLGRSTYLNRDWQLVEVMLEEIRSASVNALEELTVARARVLQLENYIRDHGLEI